MSDAHVPHAFVGKREYGIHPAPHHTCTVCGIKRSEHLVPAVPCTAALTIKGEHFSCDMTHPHGGWAHSSSRAEAIWDGHRK